MNVSGGRCAVSFLRKILCSWLDQVEQVAELRRRVSAMPRTRNHRGSARSETPATTVLQRRRHVDQHVAAADQIHARERRIDGDVLPGEDAQIAHRLFWSDSRWSSFVKKRAQPLGADLGLDALRVEAGAGLVERTRDRPGRWRRSAWPLAARTRPGTRASAIAIEYASWPGRAPGHPDPDRLVPRRLPSTISGNTVALQLVEHSGSRKKLVTLIRTSR